MDGVELFLGRAYVIFVYTIQYYILNIVYIYIYIYTYTYTYIYSIRHRICYYTVLCYVVLYYIMSGGDSSQLLPQLLHARRRPGPRGLAVGYNVA